MVNMRSNHQRTPSGSPRAVEVGEIDTRAPFQSVRAAVSLFGTIKSKASFPSFKRQSSTASESSKPSASERETRLMLAVKDLAKFKTKLYNAETTKAQALHSLDKAKQALDELNIKIMSVKESKHMLMEAAEDLREQALRLEEEIGLEDVTADGPWKEELDHMLDHYKTIAGDLYSTKQSLAKIRHDFEVALEAKQLAFQQASEAHCSSKAHSDKANELRKEIAAMNESAENLKLEAQRSSKVQAKIMAERDSILQSYKPAKEEAELKLKVLRKEFNPEMTKILEQQYAETTAEIQEVKEQMRLFHGSEMSSIKDITDELNKVTKTLQEVCAEESEIRESVASLRKELESVQKERDNAEEKEQKMETLAVNLQEQLDSCKAELEGLADLHTDELFTKLHRLLSGIHNDKRAVEEIKKNVDDLNRETENAQKTEQESEKQLQEALTELEEAKAGEKHAADQLRNVSTVCTADFGTGSTRIRMSKKDYENLNRKHEEADNLAEMKVAAVMFQVGAISAKKSEADIQVETTLKEIERMQAVIDFALKQAEASEAAQKGIEAELESWRK